MPIFFFRKGAGLPEVTRPTRCAVNNTSCSSRAMPRSVTSKPTSLRLTPSSFCFANASRPTKSPLFSLQIQPRFASSRVVVFVDLVTVKRHARFEPQSVTRGQTAGQHAFAANRISGVENLVPELLSLVGSRVDFEAIFAGVASAGNDRRSTPSTCPRVEMVVLDFIERSDQSASEGFVSASGPCKASWQYSELTFFSSTDSSRVLRR